MLIFQRKIVLAISLLFLLFTVSCSHTVATVKKVELNRTPELNLVVKNTTTDVIKILPAQDETRGAAIDLAPQQQAEISFQLFTIADLVTTDYSWMQRIKGSETNIIETRDPVRYIDMQGEDGLILIRNAQDQLWQFLLDLGSCMDHPHVIEALSIKGPPEAGIPVDLCE